VAGLQRLAQGFEDTPVELREFIEEQYAVVGEADLAGPRCAATVSSTNYLD